MSIAQHAERILAAWTVADPERFETELESALHCCRKQKSRNFLEMEQQELLESVVERLRGDDSHYGRAAKKSSGHSLTAGFALLQHLSHSVQSVAN